MATPWAKIRTEWLKGGTTYKKLAEKYHVSAKTIALTGIWETIIQWMYDGMQVPPAELAAFLSNVYFYGGRTVLLGDVV